ncbi:hypothetical protein AALP_AAs61114U000100, partial [Arabis alpina]
MARNDMVRLLHHNISLCHNILFLVLVFSLCYRNVTEMSIFVVGPLQL